MVECGRAHLLGCGGWLRVGGRADGVAVGIGTFAFVDPD